MRRVSNIQRGDEHWTRREPEKHAAGLSSLTPAKVRDIRRRIRAREPHASIAADYGVCADVVSRIKRRVAWAWVTDEAADEPRKDEAV